MLLTLTHSKCKKGFVTGMTHATTPATTPATSETAQDAVSAQVIFPATLGLDVGDKLIHYCFIGAGGDILDEGRVRTYDADVRNRLGTFGHCRAVIEAGQHSPWLYRLLRTLGDEVIVANPRKFQLIRQSRHKTDHSDAELLARVGRVDPVLLSPIEHRSEQYQVDLALLRSRGELVTVRTGLINHVRGSVKAMGEVLPRWDADSFHRHAPDHLPAALAPTLLGVIEVIAKTTEQIKAMEKTLDQVAAERYPQAAVLRQVNGAGPITALTFVLTLGDPARFARSRYVGPYLGLTPRQRQSGDRAPQLRITKAGDSALRSLLVQSAHYILGPFGKDCNLRRWGLERLERGGQNQKKRVLVAVARKLSVLLHHLLVTGEVYDPFFGKGADNLD